GPLAPAVYRAPAPYPYRGVTTEDALAGLDLLFKQDIDPGEVACMVLEPVQGEGGFIPMPAEFVRALKERCERHDILYVDDEVQSGCGRTGTVWAIERLDVEPDLIVGGKTLGGGLPLASVTGKSSIMDAVHPGGLGGTFGGNPVACAAAAAVLDELAAPGFRERAEQIATLLRRRLDEIATRRPLVGEVRGLGAMLALELTERNPAAAKRTVTRALERGLVLLSCGLDGNVIRLLPPLSATDDELERGLAILEEALGDAGASYGGGNRPGHRTRGSPLRDPACLRRRGCGRWRRPRHRSRGVLHDARPVRIRQDDDAARHRRLRAAGRRPRRARRRRRHSRRAFGARREHRVPGLRA